MCKRLNYFKIMKKLVFCLLFFLPITLFSQESVSPKFKKFELGYSYSADYSYRNIKSNETNRDIINLYDTIESAKYGYTTGINGTYFKSNKLSFSLGCLLSDKGEKSELFINSTIIKLKNHYYYLDIPIKANYYFLKENNKFYVTAGISSNIFLFSTISNFSNEKAGKNNINLNTVNFAALGGVGFDFSLSDSWHFKSELLYRHSLQPIMDSPIKRSLFSIGLNFGFSYRF